MCILWYYIYITTFSGTIKHSMSHKISSKRLAKLFNEQIKMMMMRNVCYFVKNPNKGIDDSMVPDTGQWKRVDIWKTLALWGPSYGRRDETPGCLWSLCRYCAHDILDSEPPMTTSSRLMLVSRKPVIFPLVLCHRTSAGYRYLSTRNLLLWPHGTCWKGLEFCLCISSGSPT